MKTTLKLATDYKTLGNDSDRQIDTLAMAMVGQTCNGIEEDNWEYLSEAEHVAKRYWVENDSESFFRDSLTKEQLLAYADDLSAYDAAFEEYKDLFDDVRAGDWDTKSVHANAMKACADAMEKSLSDAQTELWHDFLYGDYYGNFDGVIPTANKYIDGIEFDYDEKADTITIEYTEETLKDMQENGDIENATETDIKDYVESAIESRARSARAEQVRKSEERREQSKKTREYQEKARAATIERKKNTLKELAAKK